MNGDRKPILHHPHSVAYVRARKDQFLSVQLLCAVALANGSSFSLAAGAKPSADTAPVRVSERQSVGASQCASIPWSQIGAKAGADYQGDGLTISPTADGARLRCVFQRLEGEATREGLWLTSTVSNAVNDRFRIMAVAVGRQSSMAGD